MSSYTTTSTLASTASAAAPMSSSASQEDIFRLQVATLMARCNNDVPTLMKAITRSLNECGRTDVRVDVDTTGTIVSVAQSPFHVSAHLTNFQLTLDQLVADAKKQLAAIVPPKGVSTTLSSTRVTAPVSTAVGKSATTSATSAAPLVPPPVATATTAVSSSIGRTSAIADKTGKRRSASATTSASDHQAGHRCFKDSREHPRDEYPTSQFNGNYLLYRYGGHYPKHANYGFYKRYGMKGLGATTSEFHNAPAGLKPDRQHIFS